MAEAQVTHIYTHRKLTSLRPSLVGMNLGFVDTNISLMKRQKSAKRHQLNPKPPFKFTNRSDSGTATGSTRQPRKLPISTQLSALEANTMFVTLVQNTLKVFYHTLTLTGFSLD